MTTDYSVFGFFCDLVLTDQEDRHSLIGIMPPIMRITDTPFPLPLGIFVRISPAPPPETPIKLLLSLSGIPIMESQINAPPKAEGQTVQAMHLALKQIVVHTATSGHMVLTVAVGDELPQNAISLDIEVVPPNGSEDPPKA